MTRANSPKEDISVLRDDHVLCQVSKSRPCGEQTEKQRNHMQNDK